MEKSNSGISRNERLVCSVFFGIGFPLAFRDSPGADDADHTGCDTLREDDEDRSAEPRLADQNGPIRMLALLEGDCQLIEEDGHRLLERHAVLDGYQRAGSPRRKAPQLGSGGGDGAIASIILQVRRTRGPPGCYSYGMNAVRGRVRGGRIELEGALPEGAEVVVLTPGTEAPFDLDDAQLAEIEARMAAADRGEIEPVGAVLERLRRNR